MKAIDVDDRVKLEEFYVLRHEVIHELMEFTLDPSREIDVDVVGQGSDRCELLVARKGRSD